MKTKYWLDYGVKQVTEKEAKKNDNFVLECIYNKSTRVTRKGVHESNNS